jgi:hypothetical protein
MTIVTTSASLTSNQAAALVLSTERHIHVGDDSNPPNAAITTAPSPEAVDPLSDDAGVTLIEPRPARNQPLQASLLPFESMPQL